MSEFVETAQPKSARQVWSLGRAYSQSPMPPPPASSADCVPRPGPLCTKRRPSISSVASVAYASSFVASSLYPLRRVEFAFHTTPKSTLSGVLLQMRRTVRRAKLQRNTERFVSLTSILGRIPGFG